MVKNRRREDKITLMLTAAAAGDVDRVKNVLGTREVDINSGDTLSRTALHVASAEGHLELVKHLLRNNADPYAKDKMGNTPLRDAVTAKRDRVAAAIRKASPGCVFTLPGNELGVKLCEAAFEGDLEQIKRLLANGVDPNESDYDGRTALHLAACEGHTQLVSFLLEAKAEINATDRFGGTALEDAVRHNGEVRNAKHVQAMLRENGADLSSSDTDFIARVNTYADEGNIDGIRLLTENRVDVGRGDYDGRTPLHLAACSGQTSVLEFLLQQPSVMLNAVDRFGGTFVSVFKHARMRAHTVARLRARAQCARTHAHINTHATHAHTQAHTHAHTGQQARSRTPSLTHSYTRSQVRRTKTLCGTTIGEQQHCWSRRVVSELATRAWRRW
jgi:ankyrin repeat protein